jgi:hypothetical protein
MNRLGRLSLDERRNSDIGRADGGYREGDDRNGRQ